MSNPQSSAHKKNFHNEEIKQSKIMGTWDQQIPHTQQMHQSNRGATQTSEFMSLFSSRQNRKIWKSNDETVVVVVSKV